MSHAIRTSSVPESWFLHALVNLMFNFCVAFLKSVTQDCQLLHKCLNTSFCDCTTLSQKWLRCHPGRADPPSNNEIDFRTSHAICVFYFVNFGTSRAIPLISISISFRFSHLLVVLGNVCLSVQVRPSICCVWQCLFGCSNLTIYLLRLAIRRPSSFSPCPQPR